MDVWLLRQHTCFKSLCRCIYTIYAYSIYRSIEIYFRFYSNWLPVDILFFSVQGTEYEQVTPRFVFFVFISHIEGILLKVWDRWLKEMAKDMSWIWTQAAHLEMFFLHFSLCSSFSYLCSFLLLSTTSLLPAWGRSMHVLYSGLAASSVPSSHLLMSLPSLSVHSCTHTNKQWCLICRLFTFH